MSDDPQRPADPYSRAEYRRLIAWEARIEREAPFLTRLLETAPEQAVVDLGCGSGEHVAFFARAGCRAVGLDRSEAMLEAARVHAERDEGRFVLGDARAARAALPDEAPFGLALCLGNMLPHLQEDTDLEDILAEAHGLLLPGGLLLVQILNYARIVDQGIRSLPVNVRPGDEGEEIVFLRLMKTAGPGRILFFPTTLTLHPDEEEPVRVRTTRRVPLRAWTLHDLQPRFEARGFAVRAHGDMEGGPYAPASSADLVLVATRR